MKLQTAYKIRENFAMKNSTLILLIFYILTWTNYLPAQINIELWTDKSTYVEGEPTFLHVKLRNNTDISFMFELYDEENIIIKDQNNRQFKSETGGHFFYRENILPNTAYKSSRNLTSTYGKLMPNTSRIDYFPHGSYTVQIHVYDPRKKVDMLSPKITFNVVEPNEIQKPIFEAFINAREIPYSKNNKEAYREALINFITKFADDKIYCPLALWYLQLSYQFTSQAKEKIYFDICDQMIHEHPHHPYAHRAVNGILKYFRYNENRPGAESYLKSLVKETPNEELKSFIDKHVLPRVQTKPFKDW